MFPMHNTAIPPAIPGVFALSDPRMPDIPLYIGGTNNMARWHRTAWRYGIPLSMLLDTWLNKMRCAQIPPTFSVVETMPSAFRGILLSRTLATRKIFYITRAVRNGYALLNLHHNHSVPPPYLALMQWKPDTGPFQ